MNNTDFHTVCESPRPISQDLFAGEPSHIHIPRPSRLRESPIPARDQAAADAAQLGLAPAA